MKVLLILALVLAPTAAFVVGGTTASLRARAAPLMAAREPPAAAGSLLELFNWLDTDGDGKLTRAEVARYSSNQN